MRRYVRATCVLCKFGSPVITEWKLMSSSGTNGPGKCRKKKKKKNERRERELATRENNCAKCIAADALQAYIVRTTHPNAKTCACTRSKERGKWVFHESRAPEGAVNFNSLTKQPECVLGSKYAYFGNLISDSETTLIFICFFNVSPTCANRAILREKWNISTESTTYSDKAFCV